MNLLVDYLPDSVPICGRQVKIDTDFRTGILFEQLVQDVSMDATDRLLTALRLYYPEERFGTEEELKEAVSRMLWFYRGGSDRDLSAEAQGAAGTENAFSYDHDADYIYAAFMQAYGIDLTCKPLHWWQFRALFKSLPDDTAIMKIIGYRTIEISPNMSKEQKKFYTRMKRIYRIPESEDVQRLESDLTELLMNGGDPSALLTGDESCLTTEH